MTGYISFCINLIVKYIQVLDDLRDTKFQVTETDVSKMWLITQISQIVIVCYVFCNVPRSIFYESKTVLGFKFYGLLYYPPHDVKEGIFLQQICGSIIRYTSVFYNFPWSRIFSISTTDTDFSEVRLHPFHSWYRRDLSKGVETVASVNYLNQPAFKRKLLSTCSTNFSKLVLSSAYYSINVTLMITILTLDPFFCR